MSWKRRFEDPVELPMGKIAAEDRGPMMCARIGMLQAIQRDTEQRFGPGKRVAPATKWGRRKLTRDQ